MPLYEYRCSKDKTHQHVDIVHGMGEVVRVFCQECRAEMMRVYTPFRINISALGILYDWMDENYRRYRTNTPRFSPDHVNRPGKPIPGKDYDKRRNNGNKKS
jgi:hypothetical protein